MDFYSIAKEATDAVPKTQLKILKIDEKNERLYLSTQNGMNCIYISMPQEESQEWTVWSDEQCGIDILSIGMESLQLESKSTVTEVINSLDRLLMKTPLEKKAPGLVHIESCNNDMDKEDDDAVDDNDDDEDYDEDEQYYYNDDDDAMTDVDHQVNETEDDMAVASNFFNSTGSQTAVLRLVKDLKAIKNVSADFGITGQPRGNNLFMWDIELSNIPESSRLGKDLISYGQKYKEKPVIKLDVQFPSEYPFSPPFIRVLKPRFQFLTGHITVGGSICMQALTKSGWCPANDLESILIQVRTEILSDPKASLDSSKPNVPYSEEEAKVAFTRMLQKYGWG